MNILDAFAFEFLTECTQLIDRHVSQLEAETKGSEDPDGRGILDRLEYVVGFGFVACQQYITTVCSNHNQKKKQALDWGPRHRTGQPIVAIVNAAANYWKHSPEWESEESVDRGEAIRALFAQVGGRPVSDYPITNLLFDLLSPLPARFERLVPLLASWKDKVQDPRTAE